METKTEGTFEGWVILEIMGHRKLGGYLKEQVIAGQAFMRLDVMDAGCKPTATQFYNPNSIYCITPTTQETAILFGTNHQPAPVQRWELPGIRAASADFPPEDDESSSEYADDENEY